jgi:hypothetical protein
MFDPSKYVPDLRDMALQGNDLMVKSAMANTQAAGRNTEMLAETLAQKRRDKMQLQAAMAQLAERQAARKSLEQRFGERLDMQRQNAATAQDNVLYERDQKQRATDADLVSGLVGPAASGNLNALEQARTAATMRDPSLSVRLPGERGPAVEPAPGIPGVDDVYPEETGRLRVMRGNQPVYVSPEATEMRGREAAVADLLGPNAGPWSARAVEAAGAGVTGEKAAEIARAEQNRLEGRETAERVSGARMGQQRELAQGARDARLPLDIHDRVEGMAKDWLPEVRKIDESDRAFALAERQLGTDANAFMQNKAMAGILKAYTGAAATDAERRQDAQAAGKWNYYDKLIGTWMDGGELPPEFRQQVASMVADARAENVRQRNELGRRAVDNVYSSGLPFASAREMAERGAQVYAKLTGRRLSPEELERETQHIAPDFAQRRGGRAASAMGGALPSEGLSDDAFIPPNDMGDMGGFAGGSGARDALPVVPGKPPPIPLQPPAQDPIDRELDDEAMRLLEAY